MRKVYLILSSLIILLLCSCQSLPKTVKAGDTLVIGCIECDMEGYEKYDVPMDGKIKDNIEVTIINTKNNKQTKVKTDEDGFFYVTGLIAHDPYVISNIKISKVNTKGQILTTQVTINENNRKQFVPYDNMVVNIGTTTYSFNGKTNYVTWDTDFFYYPKRCFEKMEVESEWKDKKVVEQK